MQTARSAIQAGAHNADVVGNTDRPPDLRRPTSAIPSASVSAPASCRRALRRAAEFAVTAVLTVPTTQGTIAASATSRAG